MAAVLLCALAAFVIHTGFLFPTGLAVGDECPSNCLCLGSIVDCSKRGLTNVPTDLPHWVKQLDFQGNELTTLPSNAFEHLDKLDKLILSHNKLRAIPIFPQGCNLTTLVLSHNAITEVSAASLQPLQRLCVLELHFNQLTSLPAGSFPVLPSLHHLFLNNNKLGSLEPGVFDNLTSLEWLKLSKNKLTTLPKEFFSNLKKLKILDLNRNKLRSVQGLTFNGMEALETLKLKRNQITELEDGAFYEMKKIELLQLDYNAIGSVTKGWLFGLSTLKQLSLSHSNISRVDADCWDHLGALEELDLTANKITTINERTFIKLKALKELKLNNNSISVIEEGAFSGLADLEALEMNHNEISWTNENMNGAFDGLTSLSRLGLDSNRIKSIGKRAFSGLGHLQHLNLDDNAINSIQLNAFSEFNTLKELRLNSSNLVCDCQLSWLPTWLRDLGFDSSVNGRCAHPENLQGRSIFEISIEEFDCDDYLRPVITRDLTEQKVILGSNVTMVCEAASSSSTPMAVLWKKDEVIWKSGDVENYGQTSDGEITKVTSMLHIRHVDYSAEGTYQCVISNELGTTYSNKATIIVQVYPRFTKRPGDITVRAGAVARLECAANGVPPPEISWKKVGHDFPAARERRIHMMERGDTVFIIREVKTRDQGVYSCTATSDAGLIVANATVQVQEVPAFVESMSDKSSEEGQTAVVECLSSGSPKPRISWLKDGQPLVVTDRHFFTADNQLLIIMKSEVEDTGAYTCEMTNTLGTERGTSYLSIHAAGPGEMGAGGGLDDESTTTGIIIIAVVCCVVGTSLVWVIIIYQTRKKTEEYSSTPTDETTLPGEGPGTPYNSSDRDSRSSPGPLPPPHFSGSFSHMEDERHQSMLPPGGGDDGSASSSLAALHRMNRSDGDSCTDHSSSPSSRSTHSTGLLHTFHPYGAVGSAGGSQGGLDIVEPCTSATELLQSYPGAVAVAHMFPHSYSSPRAPTTDGRSRSVPHAPRPPDPQQGRLDPRDYQQSSASNSQLHTEVATPATQSLPLPPKIPKDQQVSSPAALPMPPHHHTPHHPPPGHPAPPPPATTFPVYTSHPTAPSHHDDHTSSSSRLQQQPYQQKHLHHQPHHQHHHPQQQQLREGSLSAIPSHLASSEPGSLSNSYTQLPHRTS